MNRTMTAGFLLLLFTGHIIPGNVGIEFTTLIFKKLDAKICIRIFKKLHFNVEHNSVHRLLIQQTLLLDMQK